MRFFKGFSYIEKIMKFREAIANTLRNHTTIQTKISQHNHLLIAFYMTSVFLMAFVLCSD